MTVEIIIVAVASLFFIMSIFLFNGKGRWLIAGYNTLSEEERKKYDEKKVCRGAGGICIVCSVMLYIMAYMGYRVDSGRMDELYMLPFALFFAVGVLTSVVIVIKYINNKAKK